MEESDKMNTSAIEAPMFQPFPKIARFSRDIIVTEKIDGTNAQVEVLEDGRVLAGSRTRYITPADDNFGFAAWVKENEDALRELGPGRHFGEWWGRGIQRNYGQAQRRFSLFNVSRWARECRPACCDIVPVLYAGPMNQVVVHELIDKLRSEGSVAAPGFMKPEGIMIFHTAANIMLKKTIEDDDLPKAVAARQESLRTPV